MLLQTISHTYKRYRTLQTHRIQALPIVILMPHSACNCRCIMCDIWKDNKNLKQLTENDITGLMDSLKKLGTRQVLMSGGEALLNTNFFRFCEILNEENIKVTLLSTGLTIKKNAEQLIKWVNDIIVSVDGDEQAHDYIRNIPGAFNKLKEGISYIKAMKPSYKITSRTVIHRINYQRWPLIIEAAKEIGLDQISFLPADVSSHAFNREMLWDENRQHEILLSFEDLPYLKNVIQKLMVDYKEEFKNNFIAESPEKIWKIYEYYAAYYGLNPFPYKKCNAPWVSTVIEADGTVKPCFFHDALGNIHKNSLNKILNSDEAIHFRETLNISVNATCVKCVCYLNLPVSTKVPG
jgi:MoaA/NifB/PqqE/SkfB family radical SAM enzyme